MLGLMPWARDTGLASEPRAFDFKITADRSPSSPLRDKSPRRSAMGIRIRRGYAWAIAAGFMAALAAISAKFFSSQVTQTSSLILDRARSCEPSVAAPRLSALALDTVRLFQRIQFEIWGCVGPCPQCISGRKHSASCGARCEVRPIAVTR